MIKKRPFASHVQMILIGLLLLSFALITQKNSKSIYQAGMLLLIFSTLLQIAFGNIPPETNFKRSILYVGIAAAIISGIIFLAISIAPSLINLGRG